MYPNEGESSLKIGMRVCNETETYNLYNNYALNKGFSIRKHETRYKFGTKILRERSYVCFREGFRDVAKVSDDRAWVLTQERNVRHVSHLR